jgi:hypothetical protein
VASLDGQLGALIRAAELTADRYAAALAGLPPPWWLHADLDVLTTAELAAVDYPQPGGLTWDQLASLTATALATNSCAGWSICDYNPDLDPGRDGADACPVPTKIVKTILVGNGHTWLVRWGVSRGWCRLAGACGAGPWGVGGAFHTPTRKTRPGRGDCPPRLGPPVGAAHRTR